MAHHDLQEQMTAYLLGELSDPERAALEDLYFTDDVAHRELLAAEEELIDSYARGELSGKSREQFERLFLGSARRREKLEIARLLISVVDRDAREVEPRRETSPSSARRVDWRFAFLTGAAALGLAIGLSVFHQVGSNQLQPDAERQVVRTGGVPGQQPSELEAASRERMGDGDRPPDPAAPEAPVERLTLRLKPMLRGEGESNQSVLRTAAPIVRLEADLEGRLYETYEAVLQDAAGSTILRQAGLSRRGRMISWPLETRGLSPGAYAVVLWGRDARGLHLAGQYSLKIR